MNNIDLIKKNDIEEEINELNIDGGNGYINPFVKRLQTIKEDISEFEDAFSFNKLFIYSGTIKEKLECVKKYFGDDLISTIMLKLSKNTEGFTKEDELNYYKMLATNKVVDNYPLSKIVIHYIYNDLEEIDEYKIKLIKDDVVLTLKAFIKEFCDNNLDYFNTTYDLCQIIEQYAKRKYNSNIYISNKDCEYYPPNINFYPYIHKSSQNLSKETEEFIDNFNNFIRNPEK